MTVITRHITTKYKKSKMINVYLDSDNAQQQTELLKQAAKLAHRSMSNFILTAALEAAEAMVEGTR